MPKPANYNKLVLAHGVTMALALLWFIPIAIFAAAFLRSRPQRPLPESEKPGTIDHHSQQYRNQNEQGHGSQAWKYIHIAFNVTATALIIAGFTLGYYASGNSFQVGVKNAHFIIGLTFFVGILVQAIFGSAMVLVNAKRNVNSRPWYNYIHILFGYPLALLGVANIWFGLRFHGSPHYLYALWIVAVAIWFVIYLVGIEAWRYQLTKRHKTEKVEDEKRYKEHSTLTHDDSLHDTDSGNHHVGGYQNDLASPINGTTDGAVGGTGMHPHVQPGQSHLFDTNANTVGASPSYDSGMNQQATTTRFARPIRADGALAAKTLR